MSADEAISNNSPRCSYCHAAEHLYLHWVGEIVKFLTSVGRRLFSIGLNLHTTGDTAVGFATGQISDVDVSVVEGGEEMDNTEVVAAGTLSVLSGTEVVNLLFLRLIVLVLLGALYIQNLKSIKGVPSCLVHLPF